MSSKPKVPIILFTIYDNETETQLEKARAAFVEKDKKGDGHLQPEAISEVVQKVLSKTKFTGFKSTPQDVKQFMKQIKSQREKELTYYEFENYFAACLDRAGHKITESGAILRTNRAFNPAVEIYLNTARKQFAKYDNDKSGSLDQNEVYKLITETHQLIGKEKEAPSEEDVKYYIELADSDSDGLISIQEYEDLFLMNLKQKGQVVIERKVVVNPPEIVEKTEKTHVVEETQQKVVKEAEEVIEKPKLSSAPQTPPPFVIKNVYNDDVEEKLNHARKLFIQRDEEKKGRLDQSQIVELVNTTFTETGVQGAPTTPEDVKHYMDAVEANQSGSVSYEEYERYVVYCLKKNGADCNVKSNFIKSRRTFNPEAEMQLDQARKFFAKFDTDRSGFLEENEIYGLIAFTYRDLGMNSKPTAADVKKYMQMADSNHDGRISIAEFEDLVLQNYRQSGIVVIEQSSPEVTVIQETHNEGDVSVTQSITITKVTTVTTTRTPHQVKHHSEAHTELKVLDSTHSSVIHHHDHHEQNVEDPQIKDSKKLDEPLTESKKLDEPHSESKKLDEPLTESKKFQNKDGGIEEEEEKQEIRFVQSMIRTPEDQKKDEQPAQSFDELNVVVKNDNQPDISSSEDEGETEVEEMKTQKDEPEDEEEQVAKPEQEDEEKKLKKSKSSSSSSSSSDEEEQKVKKHKRIDPAEQHKKKVGSDDEDDDNCEVDDDDEADTGKKVEGQKPYVKEAHRQNLQLLGIKKVYDEQVEAKLDVARRLFIQHDVNKTGNLDAEGVSGLISHFFAENGIEGYTPTPEDVKLYIEEVDTNKDGYVQYQEFEVYVIRCLEKVGLQCEVKDTIVRSNRRFNPEAEIQLDIARKQFARCDTDRSGYLEENEIYALIKDSYEEMGIMDYQPTEEDVQYYIKLADTDNDGRISIVEFEDLIIISLKQSGLQVIQYKQPNQAEEEERNEEKIKRAPANEHLRRGDPVENTNQPCDNIQEKEEEVIVKKLLDDSGDIQDFRPPVEPENMKECFHKVDSQVGAIEENRKIVCEPITQEEEVEIRPKKPSFPSIVIKKVYDTDIEEKLQIARKLFILSDKDQNGELDPEEVVVLIKNTFANSGVQGYEPTLEQVKDYIDTVDTDKNGLLSYDEYENYIILCFEKAGLKCDVKDTILKSSRRFNPSVELKLDVARRLFAKYDTDRSGELEENEVYGIISDTYRSIGINDFKPTVDDVRSWIQMADTDNNGTVSIYEYENLILTSLEKAGIEIKKFTTIK